jgi:hypothetical protein
MAKDDIPPESVKELPAPAPRVTEQSINEKIQNVEFIPHGILTICVITMANGYMVVGHSAPASPENYNLEKGRRFAYENAFKQIWSLEGYALRERLAPPN